MQAAPGSPAAPYIPLRAAPSQADQSDPQRIRLVRDRWGSQDVLLAARDRQLEENVRMLSGRQWEVFSPQLGRHVDVSTFMSDAERAFRQRPVVNKLLYWFILTHARLTENPPVVSFQPSTADRLDAQLAEVMDPVFKTLWHETGMLEAIDRLMAWMIPCGQAYLKTRVDFTKGAQRPFPQYGPPGEDGQPAVVGEAMQHEGGLAVDVLSPLEVRGEWNAKPWHEKRWHMHRTFLTTAEVRAQYGVEVKPDATGFDVNGVGSYLTRLLFGAGNYGAVGGQHLADADGTAARPGAASGDGYVVVDELWEKPCPELPGGRLLVVTANKVLWDSARPFDFRGASPIRSFAFVNVPGRPTGTSPQEMMNPIQRAYNRGYAQILEHRALMTNPVVELDANSGLKAADFVSRPGAVIPVLKRPGVDAFRFVTPPQLSGDVWRTQDMLANELDVMGNVHGGQGNAPTSDASGELVKELRFNSDRFIGPTAKRCVLEFARLADDWQAILPVLWPFEKVLTYSGEDNIARAITVQPEMWEGKIHCIADVESMLPEGRGERQARVQHLYELGALGGPPGAPIAVKNFLELSRFPHLSRTIRPGGTDRVMAEHCLALLLQGAPATELPLLPWYDYAVHRMVLEDFMKGPEHVKQPPPVQAALTQRWEMVKAAQQLAEQQAAQEAMQSAALTGAVQGAAQTGAASTAPAPAAPSGASDVGDIHPEEFHAA